MPLPGLNYGRALASAAGAAQNQRGALATLIGVWGGGRDYRTSGGGTDYRDAAAQRAEAERQQYEQEQADRAAADERNFAQQKELQGSAFTNQNALEALKQTGREGLLGERLASAEDRQRAALEAQAAKNAASVQAQQAAAVERERKQNEKRRSDEQIRLSSPSGKTETAERLRELATRVLPAHLNSVAQAVVASPKEMKEREADQEKRFDSDRRFRLQEARFEAQRADEAWQRENRGATDPAKQMARRQNIYASFKKAYAQAASGFGPLRKLSVEELDRLAQEETERVLSYGAPAGGATPSAVPGGSAPPAAGGGAPSPADAPSQGISPVTAQSLAEIAVMDPEEAWQEAQDIQKQIDSGANPVQDGVDLQRIMTALKSRWNTSMGPDEPFGVEETPEAANPPPPAPAAAPPPAAPEASVLGVNNTMGNQALDAVQAAQNAPGNAIESIPPEILMAAGPLGALAGAGHYAGKAMGAVGGGVLNALTGSSSFGEMGGKMFADEAGNQSAAGRAAGMALDAFAALLPIARGMRIKTGGGPVRNLGANAPRKPTTPPGPQYGPPRPPPDVNGQAVNPTPSAPPPSAPGGLGSGPAPKGDWSAFKKTPEYKAAQAKAAEALKGVRMEDIQNQMNKTSGYRQTLPKGSRERALADSQLQALIDEYNRRTGKSYKMPN